MGSIYILHASRLYKRFQLQSILKIQNQIRFEQISQQI